MTKDKCIADLKGSMDLFLFDPSTGDILSPNQLNEENRMTYEAMKAAVGFLEGNEEETQEQTLTSRH